MANNTEITNALGLVLYTADLAPVVFENGPDSKAKPRFICTHEVVSRTNPGLRRGGVVQTGIWYVKVVTDRSIFATQASNLAEQVAALYPFGDVINLSSSVLRVSMEPVPKTPIPSDAAWSVPVSVHYIVTGR